MRVFAFGEITLTVTPKRPSSLAALFVRPIRPAFAARVIRLSRHCHAVRCMT